MQIHDQGDKARRDRAKIMAKYDELTKFAGLNRLKPTELAKLSNTEFYRLCEDAYNALPRRVKVAYAESIGAAPRRNPAAFKWFYRDLIALKQAEGWRWLWYTLAAPFKYRGFLARKKARLGEAAKSNKTGPDIIPTPVNSKPAPSLKLEK